MPFENADLPRGILRSWKKGDDLSAKHFQEPIDALKTLVSGVAPVSKLPSDKIPVLFTQFRVKTINDDFLDCVVWDGITEGQTIEVAKPFLLRKTPIDFSASAIAQDKLLGLEPGTSDGYTRTLPNGRENKYIYLNVQKRKAENVADSTETEIQVIVPAYVEDDLIYCVKGIRGGIDTKNDDTVESALFWMDMNNDGRAWAKAKDQDDET